MNKSYAVYFTEQKPVVYYIDAPNPKEAALAARDKYREGLVRAGTEFRERLTDDTVIPESTVFEVQDRELGETIEFSEEELENETSEQRYYFEVERPVVCRKYECIRVKATSKEEVLELVQDETFWDANAWDIEVVDDHEVIRYDDPVITQRVKIEKEKENE